MRYMTTDLYQSIFLTASVQLLHVNIHARKEKNLYDLHL